MSLYIQSLHVKGIKLFKELNMKFNPRFNFIIGPNGVGKTSILRCLSLCVSANNVRDIRVDDVIRPETWIDFHKDDDMYRVGLGSGQEAYKDAPPYLYSPAYMETTLRQFYRPPQDDGINKTFYPLDSEVTFFSPLFLGAYRKINYERITGMTSEIPVEKARVEYCNNSSFSLNGINSSNYISNIKQWMINRYFVMEKEWATIERKNWELLIDNIKYLAPSNTTFSFKGIYRDLEPKFMLDGNECYLEELSAGFQSVLAIILSIFEWVEAVNEGSGRLVKNAEGTVIIDELDVHLHPEWQFTIRKTLDFIFPHLQFIITTHSPHLIATAEAGEVIRIPKHDGFVNIAPNDGLYTGWNTDQILEEIMDVSSIKSKQYEILVEKAFKSANEHKPEEMKKIIADLKEIAHPNDTIVQVLTMKLAAVLAEVDIE